MCDNSGADHKSVLRRLLRRTAAKPRGQISSIERIARTRGIHAHISETDAVFPHEYRFSSGSPHPGEAPGLSVDIDEELAVRYPYQRAYLPVNRLEDGTMTNW
jgi:hypothetical protein